MGLGWAGLRGEGRERDVGRRPVEGPRWAKKVTPRGDGPAGWAFGCEETHRQASVRIVDSSVRY